MAIQKKPLIVHAHIFKNAGTTIDWILKKNFSKLFCEHRDDAQMVAEPDYFYNYIGARKNLKAFSSHSVSLPLRNSKIFDLLPLVMLRHPLLRVKSVYEFERKQQADTLGAKAAKTMDFQSYVAWRMRPDVPSTIRNMQIRYLTSGYSEDQFSGENTRFELAKEFINNTPMIGVVEDFDQSMVVFEQYLLSKGFDHIDLTYQKQNVSSSSGQLMTIQESLGKLETTLGSDLYLEVCEKNQDDLRLFEVAREIIRSRFDKVVDAETKLNSIQLNAC